MDNNKERWITECQTFELDFHQKENYRWDKESFESAWRKHFERWCGVTASDMECCLVLDIGCGSRPAIDYFVDSERFYIDPLVMQFSDIPEVADAWDDERLMNAMGVPAEEMVGALAGRCDFVNCFNVLDHCFEWRKVLENMAAYCKQGAVVSFGTDITPHKGHIGIDDPQAMFEYITEHFDILKDTPAYWGRQVALLLRKK